MQAWFTPERRKAIYQFCIALGTVLVAFGVITADKAAAVSGFVLAATNLMASMNVNLLDK